MASTNKTTYYELSQYIGTDKPTYLVDYNGDMAKIDAGIRAAKTTADSAASSASDAATAAASANTAAGNASSAASAAQSSANSASSAASAAQSSADSAAAAAAANALAIQAVKDYLNIKNYITPTASVDGGITGSLDMRVTVARNDEGSLAKIYGYLGFTKNGTAGNVTVTLTNTGLTPDEAFVISPIGILRDTANANYNPGYVSCTIKANGDIEFLFSNVGANQNRFSILPACIYLIKNFGVTNKLCLLTVNLIQQKVGARQDFVPYRKQQIFCAVTHTNNAYLRMPPSVYCRRKGVAVVAVYHNFYTFGKQAFALVAHNQIGVSVAKSPIFGERLCHHLATQKPQQCAGQGCKKAYCRNYCF